MAISKESVTQAVRTVPAPGGDAVSAGWLQRVSELDGLCSVRLAVPTEFDPEARVAIAKQVHRAIARAAEAEKSLCAGVLVEFVDHAGNVIQREQFRTETESHGHRPIQGLGSAPSRPPTPQGSA